MAEVTYLNLLPQALPVMIKDKDTGRPNTTFIRPRERFTIEEECVTADIEEKEAAGRLRKLGS